MADKPEQSSTPPLAKTPMNWPKATLWMIVVFVVSLNAMFFLKSCRDIPGDMADTTGKMIDKAGHAVATVAQAFNRGTLTTSFVSTATTLSNHQHLQFAT